MLLLIEKHAKTNLNAMDPLIFNTISLKRNQKISFCRFVREKENLCANLRKSFYYLVDDFSVIIFLPF